MGLNTGAKSGCKLVTLFDTYSFDGVSSGIWVIHVCAKYLCKMVTLFDSYSYVIYIFPICTYITHEKVMMSSMNKSCRVQCYKGPW